MHCPHTRKDNINFLLISKVLDHDSQMARELLSKILSVLQAKGAYKWQNVKTLHLVCDCGPNFRNREAYAFFLHDLPKAWNVNASFAASNPMPNQNNHVIRSVNLAKPTARLFLCPCAPKVIVHFLGEQHGKGPVDQLFDCDCAWLDDFVQSCPIYKIEDLVAYYKTGVQDMVSTDPNEPKFHIMKFDPGDNRPSPRIFFQCPNFLITRTYCLKIESAAGYAHDLKVTNKVFSDASSILLRLWDVVERDMDENDADMSKTWRRQDMR